MAAGEVASPAVARGVDYLAARAAHRAAAGTRTVYNAVGFPRVFYLRYHGYSGVFPALGAGRYARLMRGNSRSVSFGIRTHSPRENPATRQMATTRGVQACGITV